MNALIVLIPTVFIVLLSFAALAFLGVWTYRDAKARGLNAVLWVLVVLLAPSLIGLIIYLAVGRNQSVALCANCGNGLSANDQFCPKCGAAARGESVDADHAPRPIVKGRNRGPLIGFFVCLGLMVVMVLALVVFSFAANIMYSGSASPFRVYTQKQIEIAQPKGFVERFAESVQDDEGLSIGVIESMLNNQWTMRFAVLQGPFRKDFSFSQGQQLVVDSNMTSGTLQLIISDVDGERNEIHDLTGGEQSFTLEDFSPGTIRVTLIAEAKDGSISVTVK